MNQEYDFNNIYKEYYQKIVRYVSRIVGPNDAEDVAQDIFDRINRGLNRFEGKSKLSTWVYRIATNRAIDRVRSLEYRHSKTRSSIDEVNDQEPIRISGTPKSPAVDQGLIRQEMSECVVEFIDNLSADYRTVIALSELEGMTNKEIAEILDISIDNVKIRLHRARAKLKESLEQGCDFYQNEDNVLACDRKPSQILSETPKPK